MISIAPLIVATPAKIFPIFEFSKLRRHLLHLQYHPNYNQKVCWDFFDFFRGFLDEKWIGAGGGGEDAAGLSNEDHGRSKGTRTRAGDRAESTCSWWRRMDEQWTMDEQWGKMDDGVVGVVGAMRRWRKRRSSLEGNAFKLFLLGVERTD